MDCPYRIKAIEHFVYSINFVFGQYGIISNFFTQTIHNIYIITTTLTLCNEMFVSDLITWHQGENYYYVELNENVSITEVLKYYWPLILVLVILVLITVLVPIVGLFFCCCRCCGNCGARTKPCDKRRDLCKKVFEGALLIILGTALL